MGEAQPHILVHGHSHIYRSGWHEGVLHINPGSAGPARFKLPRTAALLELHPKVWGALNTLSSGVPGALHSCDGDLLR